MFDGIPEKKAWRVLFFLQVVNAKNPRPLLNSNHVKGQTTD